MAQKNNITIKFKSSGAPALKTAIKALADEQDRLNDKFKGYVKGQDQATKKGRLLNNAFATMRSKLLLVNFAMAMGVKQLIGFTKEAAKVESMSRAFTTLSGGASNASIAIGKLQVATNNTMSEFDLFQQANNAMVLGITKNSDEMAEMFDVAQRLGRALGKDTAHSVESLITGIGRQSRLMLDNIGIIVKADEAYERYAQKLGTTADKLSDADKKTAFLEATMESARAKVASLGAETLSSQDSFDAFSATMKDLSVLVGDKLKGAFAGAMNAFVRFVEINKDADVETALASNQYELMAITVDRLKFAINESGRAAQHQGAAFNQGINIYTLSALEIEKMRKEIISLQLEMAKMTMIQPFPDDFMSQFPNFERLFQTNIQVMDNFNQEAETLLNDFYTKRHEQGLEFGALEESRLIAAAQNRLIFTQEEEQALQQTILDIQNHFANERKKIRDEEDAENQKRANAEAAKILAEATKILNAERQKALSILDASQTNLMSLLTTEQEQLVAQEELAIAQAELLFSGNENMGQLLNAKETIKQHYEELEDERITREQQQYIQKLQDSNAFYSSFSAGYDQFVTSLIDMDMDGKTRREAVWGATKSALIKFMGEYLKELIISKIAQQGVAAAGQAAAISSSVVTGQSIAMAYAAASAAASLASFGANAVPAAAGISSTHALTKSLATFETGGLVGGRRHSAGGTMIEAEQGEFIMSRNAVNAVGVEAMNRINQGGGAGAVNISFSGNVMSQDFIEDEAIPMIKEAIRRGADIGVA
jgi:hypothetical protein